MRDEQLMSNYNEKDVDFFRCILDRIEHKHLARL